MKSKKIPGFCLWSERGASLAELALIMPLLALFLFGAVDFGRAYYVAIEVAGAAHAGADYGSQNWGDTSGIETAAINDAPDVPSMTVSATTYGCECADGSASSTGCTTVPNCSASVVNWVNVQTSATYTPLIPWPGVPSNISITRSAKMRAGLH